MYEYNEATGTMELIQKSFAERKAERISNQSKEYYYQVVLCGCGDLNGSVIANFKNAHDARVFAFASPGLMAGDTHAHRLAGQMFPSVYWVELLRFAVFKVERATQKREELQANAHKYHGKRDLYPTPIPCKIN